MEAPKCRVCGRKHWSGEAHVFAANEQLTGDLQLTSAANKPRKAANRAGGAANAGKGLKGVVGRDEEMVTVPGYMLKSRYNDAEKRREYMREYMKGRRGKR